VSDPVPLLAVNSESPAKLALTAPGYDPSGMPATLTVRIACPAPLVVAEPTLTPFTEKVTGLPEINPPLEAFCKVADKIASPPKDAEVGETVKVEGPAWAVIAIVAVAELFVGSGSTADLFPIVTVLLRDAPFRRLALVAATIVMVSVSPLASEAYVTVWGLSCGLLLQTPPPVDAQETSNSPAGRLSTMVAEAASGPLLVTVMVYVTFDPDSTVMGEAVCVSARSALAQLRGGYAAKPWISATRSIGILLSPFSPPVPLMLKTAIPKFSSAA
jgi:hypothetical protein